MGENHFSRESMVLYGGNLLASAVSWTLLQHVLVREHGEQATLGRAIGGNWKGKLSPVCYLIGIGLAFIDPWLSGALYAAVALWWLVPDRRIERTLQHENTER